MMTVLCLNAGAHLCLFLFFFSFFYNFTGRFLEHLGLFLFFPTSIVTGVSIVGIYIFNSIVFFFLCLLFDWVFLYMVIGLFFYMELCRVFWPLLV